MTWPIRHVNWTAEKATRLFHVAKARCRDNIPTVIVLGTSLGVIAYPLLGGRSSALIGELSEGHQPLRNNCGVCHTTPAAHHDRGLGFWPGEMSAPNSGCKTCHSESVTHHPNQTREVRDCSSCHREHRGSIAEFADDSCTTCHRDLRTTEGKSKTFDNVADFAGHPEPLILRAAAEVHDRPHHSVHLVAVIANGEWQDRANIHFSHRAHMNPAGLLSPSDGRQRREMKCQDCHTRDDEGADFRPIQFDKHCAECHAAQLRFPLPLDGKQLDTHLPHGDPDTVRAVIRERLTRYIASREKPPHVVFRPSGLALGATESAGGKPARLTPLFPGQRPPPQITPDESDWVRRQLYGAEVLLFRETVERNTASIGCAYCHVVEHQGGTVRVIKPNIPDRWLGHSRFRHDRHRTTGCTECHAGAQESDRAADVLLPSLGTCKQCHGAAGRSALTASGNCLVCHTYHREHGAPPDLDGGTDVIISASHVDGQRP